MTDQPRIEPTDDPWLVADVGGTCALICVYSPGAGPSLAVTLPESGSLKTALKMVPGTQPSE